MEPNVEVLSKRELEILLLVANCKKNSDIALHYSISPHTVETHKENIKVKLNLNNATELIAFAVIHKSKIFNHLEDLLK